MSREMRIAKGRYFYILVSMLIIPFIFISGCGEKKQISKEGEIRLEYATFSRPSFIPVEKEIIADFEKENPDIKVNMRALPYGEHNQKIQIELGAGTAPDLWLCDSIFLMEFAERGVLEELTDIWNTRMDSKEYVGIESLKDPAGRIWGIPKEIQVTGLYYNKDIFDRFGVKYPDETWTWDTIAESAKFLTKDTNSDGRIDVYGGPLTGGAGGLAFNLIVQNGGSLLDKARRNSNFNTPQDREAIDFAFSLYRKTWPSLATHASFGEDYFSLFQQERAPMFMSHYIFTNILKDTMPSLNYSVALPPKKISRTCYFSPNSFVITKGKSQEVKNAAWKFIEHYSNIETQKKLGERGEGLPFHRDAIAYVLNTEYAERHNMDIFAYMVDHSVVLDINGCSREWLDVFAKEIESGLLGITPSEKVADNLHSKVQKVLDSYYSPK